MTLDRQPAKHLRSVQVTDGASTISSDAPTGDFQRFLSHIQSPALLALARLWNDARGKKLMPSWADLPPPASLHYAKQLWGFGYDPEAGELTGYLAGDRIGKWIDADFYGRIHDLRARYGLGAIERNLVKCATQRLAVRSSGRLFKVEDFFVTGERIALPMAADGQTGDGIIGASDYISPPLLGPVELIHENMEWYEI